MLHPTGPKTSPCALGSGGNVGVDNPLNARNQPFQDFLLQLVGPAKRMNHLGLAVLLTGNPNTLGQGVVGDDLAITLVATLCLSSIHACNVIEKHRESRSSSTKFVCLHYMALKLQKMAEIWENVVESKNTVKVKFNKIFPERSAIVPCFLRLCFKQIVVC